MVTASSLSDLRSGSRKMNLSFAGCGFLGIYHVGVCSCFRRYASHLFTDKIAGASAGALAACALITGVGLGESTNYVLDVALKARSRALGPLHPSFNICQFLKEGLVRFLPDNAYEICSGRLFISLTRVSDRQNVLVSQFDSNEDLIQALNCSAFIPFYSGIIPPKYKGVRYVDGGLSDNIPILDEHTITISPFAGESDICPNDNSSSFMAVHLANTSIQVNAANFYRFSHALFPPKPEQLSQMCQNGFDDALKFLQQNDLISCSRHLRIESAITSVATSGSQMLYHNEPPDLAASSDDEEDLTYYYDKLDMSFDEDMEDYDFGDEEEEEGLEGEMHEYKGSCEECRKHRHTALTSSLPHPVVTALQAGIDSVNRGVLAPIYNLRAYKVISLLTAPWLLPLDVMVVLTRKFFEWAPYLPSDMQWFIHEFRLVLGEVYDQIQTGRHRFSARFTCQLAITETEALPSSHRPESPLYRRRHSTAKSRHGNLRDDTILATSKRARDLEAGLIMQRKNLNVGFSVDFHTHQRSPLRCMDDLRQQILEDENHQHHVKLTQLDNEDVPISCKKGYTFVSHEQTTDNPVTYDTFDNCLHITRQMDAILAYHYTEESDPQTIKVAEIYALDDPRGPRPDMSNSDLVWDSYTELKPESSYSSQPDKPSLKKCATTLGLEQSTSSHHMSYLHDLHESEWEQ